jgi:hypothetical protein
LKEQMYWKNLLLQLLVTANIPSIVSASSQRAQLLVTDNVVPRSPILSTYLLMAITSSEKSVLIRATRVHITDDGILQIVSLFMRP